MNFKNVSDDQLHNDTKNLIQKEREILGEILNHLLEVNRRRLYSKHKKASLHDYCVSLGYSDAAAGRRITAMYLLQELPELGKKLISAELHTTHLCIAKTFFNKEDKAGRPLNSEMKMEVFEAMVGSSTPAAARIAQSFSPDPAPLKELLKLAVELETLENIKRLKGLNAHSHPAETTAELFERLIKEEIARITAEPKRPQKDSQAEVRRTILRKGKCENCGSVHALEIDHRIPKAAGGPDELTNYRLLCRSCNQRAGIEFYGQKKMDPHINRTH